MRVRVSVFDAVHEHVVSDEREEDDELRIVYVRSGKPIVLGVYRRNVAIGVERRIERVTRELSRVLN
jgi:hypothetical protein